MPNPKSDGPTFAWFEAAAAWNFTRRAKCSMNSLRNHGAGTTIADGLAVRVAIPLALIALVTLLLGGCGGSGGGITDSVTATFNGAAVTQAKWEHDADCDRPAGASRWGCSIGSYRCQAVVVDRGWSVSCSRPGESVAFVVLP